jgi:hypothetical protein
VYIAAETRIEREALGPPMALEVTVYKKSQIPLLGFILLTGTLLAAGKSQESSMARLFPDIAGWQKKDRTAFYYPANLYEYINGAAENFLNYDFQVVAVQTYENPERKSLTVEIYRHSDPQDTFGVYSSEKPLNGNYLDIGTQGYYEQGTLIFFLGTHYIKMSAFELGLSGREILSRIAAEIIRRIGPQPGAPAPLAWLPAEGKVAHSERFLLKNVLGHRFLHCAFMADYMLQGGKFQGFIILATDAADAQDMVEKWLSLTGQKDVTPRAGVPIQVHDPFNGQIALEWQNRFLWGSVNAPANASLTFGEAVKKKLPLSGPIR